MTTTPLNNDHAQPQTVTLALNRSNSTPWWYSVSSLHYREERELFLKLPEGIFAPRPCFKERPVTHADALRWCEFHMNGAMNRQYLSKICFCLNAWHFPRVFDSEIRSETFRVNYPSIHDALLELPVRFKEEHADLGYWPWGEGIVEFSRPAPEKKAEGERLSEEQPARDLTQVFRYVFDPRLEEWPLWKEVPDELRPYFQLDPVFGLPSVAIRLSTSDPKERELVHRARQWFIERQGASISQNEQKEIQ